MVKLWVVERKVKKDDGASVLLEVDRNGRNCNRDPHQIAQLELWAGTPGTWPSAASIRQVNAGQVAVPRLTASRIDQHILFELN